MFLANEMLGNGGAGPRAVKVWALGSGQNPLWILYKNFEHILCLIEIHWFSPTFVIFLAPPLMLRNLSNSKFKIFIEMRVSMCMWVFVFVPCSQFFFQILIIEMTKSFFFIYQNFSKEYAYGVFWNGWNIMYTECKCHFKLFSERFSTLLVLYSIHVHTSQREDQMDPSGGQSWFFFSATLVLPEGVL